MTATIHQSLTRALTGANTRALTLNADTDKYVIFSDQHKGAGDQADEFNVSRDAYRAALHHYLRAGYRLVLLGDVEELWENSFREVFAQHGEIVDLEAAFGPDRYHRIWGNHDDRWSWPRRVRSELAPRLPDRGKTGEAIRFAVKGAGRELGTMILLHGHQGTIDSDKLAWLAKPALRFVWRPIFQNFFGIGRQSPSEDLRIRGEHDQQMRDWAASHPKLMLIAGHTHMAVWPEDDERPCYINTGCCKFSDGSITGVEIESGHIHLIQWRDANQDPIRSRIKSAGLVPLFERL